MASYFLTNKAVEDLSRIWNYTYEVWSEDQADRYYISLIGACHKLSQAPNWEKDMRILIAVYWDIKPVVILSFTEK